MICWDSHISEIALCEEHTSYNNVHHPGCPNCRQAIQDTVNLHIGDITNTHLTEYIFHTRQAQRGATILPDDCNINWHGRLTKML
jgi:hypothetical protein